MSTLLQNRQRLLFIGDSITDCDRLADTLELGSGYVKFFRDFLLIREPEKQIDIINRGISGNRITDLEQRWDADALDLQPDWLSIKIGINDLHSYLSSEDEPVTPQRFERVYADLLQRTRAHLPETKILLIDPFYLQRPDKATPWEASVLALLPEYLAVVHRMQAQFKTRLVQTHAMFQALLQHRDASHFCPEPVHPNATGHLAIAEAVYTALSK